ncbi:sulfite exporter TauE/SafE family protein [Paracoccus subflavus]|uniref:Probable membrane transporter protein n=1 Tax=Paracoccus subflavus TaxID=2528244 RepID=A0A4Q9G0A5_9RHOB|nr:sulfite exporter TauE/SafE family protein [Paracoccus subflavus]TBN39502.1 sulfite exporter TauE/SafE family protein [Paracoccus subflavus]
MLEAALLFAAGLMGGMLNAVAGGGTFITFPTLVFIGIPPVAANATTTVAALPGYLSSAIAFRHDIRRIDAAPMVRLTIWTMIGGALGSGLLLVSSNEAFSVLVPFLLLAATLVFTFATEVRRIASRWQSVVRPFGLGILMPVAIYGGYFNGGLGIVILAMCAMWGMVDLHQMNGLKCWLSFALSLVAFVVFAVGGAVAWGPCAIMAAGTITGGYAGAPVARRIPRDALRLLIAVIGFGMTAIFFWRLIQGA